MPRKRWTPHEINVLRGLGEKGFTPEQIFESGQLPGRTFQAIYKQMKRLSLVRQKKFYGGHVKPKDVAELDEIIRRYVTAFRQICKQREFSRDEIERFKVIFQAAAKYRDLFFAYAEVKGIDKRLAELEKMVKSLQTAVSHRKTAKS